MESSASSKSGEAQCIRYSSRDKVAAAGVGSGVGVLVGAAVGVVGSGSGVGADVGSAALGGVGENVGSAALGGVGEKEPAGGVAWPSSSEPQQATEPSLLTPQECPSAALTETNELAVGRPSKPQSGSSSSPRSFSSATSRKPTGTHPVNWLPERYSSLKLERLLSAAGIGPVNSLPQRSRISGWRGRPDRPGSARQMVAPPPEVQVFQVGEVAQRGRDRPCQLGCPRGPRRLERSPNSAGIGPVNWLTESRSNSRLARSPSQAGIAPSTRSTRATGIPGW